jgi:hypothetical protein
MKSLTMMVTADGRWVLPASEDFLAALGDPDPDYDSLGFAVRNLGFIKFQILDGTLIEIELCPRNVARAALEAAQEQVLGATIKLFRLKYFDGDWQSEISASAGNVVARLAELCAPVFRPAASEQFRAEPEPFANLFEKLPTNDNFRPLAQKWRASFGHFDPNILSLAANHNLLERLTIVAVERPGAEPTFRYIGLGHKWVAQDYQLYGIGQKVADLPDKDYGAWAAGFYRSVANSGRPRLDRISAAMRYDSEAEKPRRQVDYERLLLPWKTASDGVLVTACTRLLGNSGTASSPARKSARSS